MKIQTLAYFPDQIARNGSPVLDAILNSLKYHGIQCCPDDLDCDAALIWSVLWQGRMAPNKKVFQHYRGSNRPVIVVDIGALSRGHTWKIALNHITAQGYYGQHRDLDYDRPKKLGIKLTHPKNPKPNIILASQHTSSLQVQEVNLVSWLDNKISEIREVSDRPLILRPHPRCRMDLQRFQRQGVEIQHPRQVPNTYDSFDFDTNYHAIINYNSGPGIQAAITGTRPIVDASSLASPVSINVSDVEKPYLQNREQWLVEVCHTEYTVEEITQGRWIERLRLQ